MAREYILTYTQKDKTETIQLNQVQMDNILAIGDAHPLKGKPGSCTVTVESTPDNRLWWGNNPVSQEQAEYMVLSAMTQLLQPAFK